MQLEQPRHFKTSLWSQISTTPILVTITLPLIYGCIVPFVLMDIAVALYQAVCFRIYKIPKVLRKDFFRFDRGRLPYLNLIEKLGCLYCSYANGLLAYVSEVAARTEQHFCPIKHAGRIAKPHSRYGHFLPYGDSQEYRKRWEEVARDFDDLK